METAANTQTTLDQGSDTAVIESLTRELERRRSALPPSERAARISVVAPDIICDEPQEDHDRRERDRLERQRNERWYDLCQEAGRRYAACRLDNFACSHASQIRVVGELRKYCDTIAERIDKREGVVFYGPVGTGKDHLAFAIARAAVGAFRSVHWLNGQQWFGEVRDAMDSDTPEARLIGRIGKPDLVVVSDPLPPIGQLTQHQATMIYRAVHARYEMGKPTILTLNVADDSEADQRLGCATWDRVCDGAWKVLCRWPSHRKPSRLIE